MILIVFFSVFGDYGFVIMFQIDLIGYDMIFFCRIYNIIVLSKEFYEISLKIS